MGVRVKVLKKKRKEVKEFLRVLKLRDRRKIFLKNIERKLIFGKILLSLEIDGFILF